MRDFLLLFILAYAFFMSHLLLIISLYVLYITIFVVQFIKNSANSVFFLASEHLKKPLMQFGRVASLQ